MTPLITNDAIVLGILMAILGVVFITAHSEVPLWKKFYTYVPPLLLCYFVPSIFSTVGLYSGDVSKLYTIASQYLLPTSLVLLTISIDLKAIGRLLEKGEVLPEIGFDGPIEATLGNIDSNGNAVEKKWADEVSENPSVGATEMWEFFNFTADAHPMHVHEVVFEVVNREKLVLDEESEETVQPVQLTGDVRAPEAWETGFKDTVVAYPGEVTRIRAKFDTSGQFVWHCHIVEHEDNEMMRPYRIGPVQPGQPD